MRPRRPQVYFHDSTDSDTHVDDYAGTKPKALVRTAARNPVDVNIAKAYASTDSDTKVDAYGCTNASYVPSTGASGSIDTKVETYAGTDPAVSASNSVDMRRR